MPPAQKLVPEEKLGSDLYEVKPFLPVELPKRRGTNDQIVFVGNLNVLEQEDVSVEVPGRVIFIGIPVDDSAVLAAGSAAFLAEPYYNTKIWAGRTKIVKFFRRLYEGDTVDQGTIQQVLGMINPAEAIGTVMEKEAKIKYAIAEHKAAQAAEEEGRERYVRAKKLYDKGGISKEDLGAAILTKEKLISEQLTKFESIKLAEIEKDQADIKLRQHEVRALMPHNRFTIKSISRQTGYYVKQLEPTVMTVQNLDRLQAEALVEEQYFARLKERKNITATIEPTILEDPVFELPGHALDVTTVGVSKDMKIVSGSEDGTVFVWLPDVKAPLRIWSHFTTGSGFPSEDAVKVLACSPRTAEKNLCLVGCASGSIYLWDLDSKENKELKFISPSQAHGHDHSITSVAFSPDGKLFATGASDGSIRLWTTWTKTDDKEDYGTELYPFEPKYGVAQCHEDAVTALHFTPQGRLISAGRDKTLRVWKLKAQGAAPDGKAIKFREGNVPQLGVSEDGRWMLFDQRPGRTLKMLSVETQTPVHTLNVTPNSTPFDTLAVFSPDSSLILTAGAPEGRLQLWRTPDEKSGAFEVRQFGTAERAPVSCVAFSPDAGKALPDGKRDPNSFAVSAAGHKIYGWSIPTPAEVADHCVPDVPLTLINQNLEPGTKTGRVGFRMPNPNGRFEAGRPVRIVID